MYSCNSGRELVTKIRFNILHLGRDKTLEEQCENIVLRTREIMSSIVKKKTSLKYI